MTTKVEWLKRIAPEFSDFDQAKLKDFIKIAELRTSFGEGDLKNIAIAYLAAHLLTITQRPNKSGNQNSVKEGQLQVSYNTSDALGGLESTSYGQEYMKLRRENVLTADVNRNHGSSKSTD